ncbi:MAG: YraN family protein [Clostridia bacterium]|nr:YraN family protein [Clostridia bacterium]
MYQNQELGKLGEDIATNYIIKKGYKILYRNFECKQGEIDIIAKDKNEIVFIEVKTRTDMSYGEASEAITIFKLKHLLNSIKYFIYKNNLENEFIRIDVIEVYIKNEDIKINHIKKAIE